jgi:hypothetical protein
MYNLIVFSITVVLLTPLSPYFSIEQAYTFISFKQFLTVANATFPQQENAYLTNTNIFKLDLTIILFYCQVYLVSK